MIRTQSTVAFQAISESEGFPQATTVPRSPSSTVAAQRVPLTLRFSADGFGDCRKVAELLEGVETTDGRDVKQVVVGVFAASAFNPREHI